MKSRTAMQRTDAAVLRRYIDGTVRAKDNRGRHHNQLACYRALLPHTTPTIAMMTAQAMRRVGECIAKRAAEWSTQQVVA